MKINSTSAFRAKSLLNTPRRIRVLAVLWVIVSALAIPATSRACDMCNVSFGQQLENERSGSLIARDFLKAVKNQGDSLASSGLGSGAFKPSGIQAEKSGGDEPIVLAQAETAPSAPNIGVVVDAVIPSVSAVTTGAGIPSLTQRFGASYGQPYGVVPDEWKDDPFIEIIERDYNLPIPATSYVPQDTPPDKTFTIRLSEGKAYIGNGVVYNGFLTNGTVPGPLVLVDEGDIVEFIVENTGTVPHGASIHAAYTQTSKYLGKINPGQSGRVVFRATMPGVFMYHCAPGGHAIPMHVLAGQYGMMVVKPKKQTYIMEEVMGRKPDIELYLVQHEFYASGKDAIEGNALYTTWNGKLFRYVEEPIKARPGDFVRINFLNVGPNLLSTFHIVGILWDYVYWQGNPGMVMSGGQTVTAGPSDSFVIDFRIPPDEGAYTMLTHAVGSATRGAIGLIVAEKDAERTALVTPEGLTNTTEEMAEITEKAVRVISPFEPTDYDQPVSYFPGTREVHVEIIGNSFWPKVIEIEPGTTVTWTNEDAFTYLAGEFAGIHNATGNDGGDEFFSTPLLAHGESASYVFEVEGTYEYICLPHPYMKGRIVVKKSDIDLSALAAGGGAGPGYLLPLVFGTFFVALIALFRARGRN